MKITGAIVVLAVLLLGGCGGTDEASAPPSADDLAAQLDCRDDSAEAADVVSCETDDAYLGIATYASNEERDAYLEQVAAGGMTVLVGDRFVIDASDPAALDAARAIVGGEVR